MKILLLASALIEGLVGLLMVFNPKLAPHLAEANTLTLHFVGMYGFAALTMSFLSILVLLGMHHQELLVNGLLTLAFFNLCICISQFLHAVDPGMSTPPKILHAVLFILFAFYYFKER